MHSSRPYVFHVGVMITLTRSKINRLPSTKDHWICVVNSRFRPLGPPFRVWKFHPYSRIDLLFPLNEKKIPSFISTRSRVIRFYKDFFVHSSWIFKTQWLYIKSVDWKTRKTVLSVSWSNTQCFTASLPVSFKILSPLDPYLPPLRLRRSDPHIMIDSISQKKKNRQMFFFDSV